MKTIFKSHNNSVVYLVLTDYLLLVGSFAVVMRLRFRPEIDIIDIATLTIVPQVAFMFFYAALVISVFGALGLYQRRTWFVFFGHLIELSKGILIAVGGYMCLQYVTKSTVFLEYRSVTLAWGMMAFCLLALNRVTVFEVIRKLVSQSNWRRRVVIIGASEVGLNFARRWLSGQEYSTLEIIGFLDDSAEQGKMLEGTLPCLGKVQDLEALAITERIEGAVITKSDISYPALMDMTETCVRLFGWVDVHCEKALCLYENLEPDSYFEIPFVRMGGVPDSVTLRYFKRCMDLVIAGTAVILLLPVMLVIAMLIKLTSPGPVFYVSDRIGYRGKRIRFYKFRSMRTGADNDEKRAAEALKYVKDDDSGLTSKIVNESLITPVGCFLRKWALDELPQLFSVVKGDMSLVGPRPSPVQEYEANDPWQKRRFDVKPGCVGLWKIYAVRHKDGSFSKTVLHDIYYARNMNPLLDIYILLKALQIVLSGKADK